MKNTERYFPTQFVLLFGIFSTLSVSGGKVLHIEKDNRKFTVRGTLTCSVV